MICTDIKRVEAIMYDIKKFEPLWGCWYVKELIGEGGYGSVYKIERNEYGVQYEAALKHIRIPASQYEIKSIMLDGMDENSITAYYEDFMSVIVKEFALMSRLKGHSNIVSYEDHKIVKSDNVLQWDIFIRMELLTSLIDYISENEITKRDVIKLGIDICKALEICQKHNIIHRDIKPENIFISENGDFKLGDFGIARQIEKTMSGLSKKGTFTYIAPEVYKGEAYGSTVDIYSLGLVMYRLLNNNRMPFMPEYPKIITHNDREIAIAKRMSGQPIPKPINADGRLAEIVLKACSYDPKGRYDSPAVMRMALMDIFYSSEEKKFIYPQGDDVNINSVHYVENEKEISQNNDDDETKTMFVPFNDLEKSGNKEQKADKDTHNTGQSNETQSNINPVEDTTAHMAETSEVKQNELEDLVNEEDDSENIYASNKSDESHTSVESPENETLAIEDLKSNLTEPMSEPAAEDINNISPKVVDADENIRTENNSEQDSVDTDEDEKPEYGGGFILGLIFISFLVMMFILALSLLFLTTKDQRIYQQALEDISDGDLESAYGNLQGILDYSDSSQKLADVKNAMYSKAVELYNTKQYEDAKKYFEKTTDIGDTSKYLLLTKLHLGYYYKYDDIIGLIDFADTKNIIINDSVYSSKFTLGKWINNNGEYYIEFYRKDGEGISSNYNMPFDVSDGKYYELENGIYSIGDDESGWVEQWSFEIVSINEINIKCIKTGEVYKFVRFT